MTCWGTLKPERVSRVLRTLRKARRSVQPSLNRSVVFPADQPSFGRLVLRMQRYLGALTAFGTVVATENRLYNGAVTVKATDGSTKD